MLTKNIIIITIFFFKFKAILIRSLSLVLIQDFSYCPHCGQALEWEYYPKRPSLFKRIHYKLFGVKKKKSNMEKLLEELDL
jgi:hypothetical protein